MVNGGLSLGLVGSLVLLVLLDFEEDLVQSHYRVRVGLFDSLAVNEVDHAHICPESHDEIGSAQDSLVILVQSVEDLFHGLSLGGQEQILRLLTTKAKAVGSQVGLQGLVLWQLLGGLLLGGHCYLYFGSCLAVSRQLLELLLHLLLSLVGSALLQNLEARSHLHGLAVHLRALELHVVAAHFVIAGLVEVRVCILKLIFCFLLVVNEATLAVNLVPPLRSVGRALMLLEVSRHEEFNELGPSVEPVL